MKREIKFFFRNSVLSLACTVAYHFLIYGLGMPISEGGAGGLGAFLFFLVGNAGMFSVGRYGMRRTSKEWKNILSVTVLPAVTALLTCAVRTQPTNTILFFDAGITAWAFFCKSGFVLRMLAAVIAAVTPYVMFCGGLLTRKEEQ